MRLSRKFKLSQSLNNQYKPPPLQQDKQNKKHTAVHISRIYNDA